MPAYNCEGTISEAVESILAQTYSDFELLILNDGSTDSTTSIITELAKRESTDHKDLHLGMEISSVECYPETKAKAEKEFSSGYKKGKSK